MHLVSPLAAGIRGAEAGTAELYVRGTGQRATYWLSFEADQAVTTGADIALDASGGAEVYVGQLVTVLVKNAEGATVREFTAGVEAPAVEVRSQSFTGADYTTGALAASNPTTLQAVLDAWKTSAGGLDFKVLVNGVSTLIKNALADISGLVYNVKSPAYGAVGNGTTDDTSAIQAAINACATAGGGMVVFPPGTYRVVAGLTMNSKVSLSGTSPYASVLKLDHASNHLLNWTTVASSQRSIVAMLGFTYAQAASGFTTNLTTGATDVTFDNCIFSGNGYATGFFVYQSTAGCHLRFRDCLFFPAGGQPSVYTGSTSWATLSGCLFKQPAGAGPATNIVTLGGGGVVRDCEFDVSAVTSGTFYSIYSTGSSAQPGLVTGCSFNAPAGGTHKVGITEGNEFANRRASAVVFELTGATASGSFINDCSSGTERLHKTGTAATNTHTMPDDVGTYTLRYTNPVAQDLNLTTPTFRMGQRIRLFAWNDTANTQAIVWVAGSGVDVVSPATSVTWNTNTYSVIDMECQYINGKKIWWINTRLNNQAEP